MQNDRRWKLIGLGLWLEYATLGWNVVGTVVVIAAANASGSVALMGFGLDSLIEIFASAVVVWQLKGIDKPERERRALRLIGSAFFLLATYVLFRSMNALISGTHPATSAGGVTWLAATLVAMVLLAWGKERTGRELHNPVLMTESRVTYVDALLAAAVLLGLLLNVLLGWWWADPVAGLIIAGLYT